MEKEKISFFFLLIFLLPCLLAKNLSPFFVSGVYPSDSILVAENKPVRLSPWDTITVVFNRPVIRLGGNWETEVSNGSVPFSFVGAVIPGRIRWVTTYMARFDTFSPWPSDLDFYLTINQDLTTFDGQRIRFDDHHPLRYHFATDTLTMSISTVTSKSAVELTGNSWNAFLAARTSPQKDGQSAEWIQGTPEVPADGFVELSFSSRVEVPLIKKALQILPAPVPSYQISECENRYGFQVQELEGGTNCIRIHFDEQLSPGFLYNFFLPKGTVYDHLSGPLASSITLPFSGPFLFIVPFYEHQVNSNGQSNEPYIENGPLPSPSDVSSSKGRRKKSPFPFYGHPSSLNWKIYLRHGLSKDTSTQQLKDCIQVFQKNSTSSEPLAIPFDILFSSPATLTIRGDYSPLTQYTVSFGKSPACVAVDGYGLPAKYSSISFETSPLQSFTCYGNDVENPIFDSSDISAKPLSWTYLSRTLERNQRNCVVSENTEDILAHATPVTLSSLPSVLCSLYSRDRNTFPTPTQTLRTSLSSSVIQSQFDTESLLTPSGLFFHWENRDCVISFRGTVSTNDLHAVTFSLGVSPSSLKVKYAVWALSSTSLTPVVGAEVHIYIGSKDCGSASQVRKVTSMTIPDTGVVFFELESLSYSITYHAVLEYQGRLQYLGELFPISHYDGNPASAVIFTDRKLYRPGDTMYVKGYVRHLSQYPIQLPTHDKYAVSVAWKDGGEETSYPVKLNQEYGSFNLTIEIPRNGEYTTGVSYGPRYCSFIRTSTDYPLYITSFDVFIGDPRPPTVLLSFQTDDEIIRPEDEGVQLNLATSSYLGLPVANADVEIHWIVIRSPISFFGPFGFYGTASTHPSQLHPPEQVISTRQSEEYGTVNVVTDTNGKFSYKLVPKLSHPLMGGDSLAVSARWISPTGEMISSSLSVKVRNSDIQIYLTPSYYPVVPQIPFAVYTDVRKSEGWEKVAGYDVTLSLVQWDGVTPIISGSSGKIEIMDTSSNLEKTFKEWKPEILNTCSLLVQIQEANACLFTLPSLGRYLIIAETKDSHNQPVRTFYPVGLNESEWNEKRFKGIEQITLRPDRDVSRDEKYSFGDVAKITYFCPYPLAKALVVFGHQSDLSEPYTEGILDMEISDGPGLQTIDIPIDSRCIEKCTVTLALFRPRGPLSSSPFSVPTSILFDPSAAAFQTASLVLSVQSQQWMTIEILPSSLRVKPGENTSVDVVVRDKYTLAPVKNAEVCVFSVNRAYIDPLPPAHFQSLSLSALSYSPDVQQMAYSTYDRLASLSGYEKSLNILLEILRVDPWSLPYWTLLSHSYMRALVDSDIEEIIQMRSDSLSLFPFYRHGGGIMYDKTPNPASLDNGQNLESFSPTSSLSDTSSSSSSSTTSPTPLELRKNFVITQLASLHAKTDAHGRASLEYTASDYIGSYTFAAFSAANDGVRFGQYPDLPSLPSLTQLVLPSSASLTPLLPRQLHLGDLAEIGVLVTLFPSSPSSSQTRKFWVVLELECDQIVADSNYEMSFEMKDGDAPREVLFSVVAVGIGKTKIQVVLWEITESGSMVSLDGFEEYVRVSGCCDEIQISSSVFLRSPSTDVPLQYEEGLQIPSAVPHTGYLINTIGVGFYPAVRTFAFSTFPSGLSDERDRYTYHLLSKLTPWPALSRYEQAQHPSFQFAKEEHFRSLVLLAAATYPTYGLQYSLNTMYPSYNLELNALGIFLNQRAVAIVGKEAGAPTFLLQIWNKALIASLYSLVSIKGRNPKDFCEQISFAYLALGRSWKPEEQYSDFLSLASLDKVILTCSPTARSYRALVDIDANQQTPLLTSLLDSLESAIRVGGRFGYVGQNRWVDVTGSAIALETLSRGNRFSREMTGMLASFVGQTVDETPDYIAIALRYGFGDQQIAYSLLALSSFDFFSDSSRPNLMFQISCERSILLSGAFKGDISNAKAMSSFTPFDSLPTPSLSTWVNGTGTVNVRSTLSFVPSRPSEKMEDFGIRVEKIIQMLNHTTRMPDGPSVTQFRKGDIVVVTIQISVPDEYTNVRVRDPLPGGLEGLDDRLNNGANMNSPGEGYLQYYFHEREFYPGSVEFQAYYLPAGVYSISYQAIAVTAGKYLLPSTKAWLLRTPEVFGISLAGEVTVFGNQPLSTSSSADTPYQKHCLPSSPTSYYRGAYFDPVPLGGYPQIWDPTISPVSLPSELVSLRMIGVFVFVCLGVALVVGLLWLRRPRHSGYSKFPQIEMDGVGSEDQDNEEFSF